MHLMSEMRNVVWQLPRALLKRGRCHKFLRPMMTMSQTKHCTLNCSTLRPLANSYATICDFQVTQLSLALFLKNLCIHQDPQNIPKSFFGAAVCVFPVKFYLVNICRLCFSFCQDLGPWSMISLQWSSFMDVFLVFIVHIPKQLI